MADNSYRTIHHLEVRLINDDGFSPQAPEIISGIPEEIKKSYTSKVNTLIKLGYKALVTIRDEQQKLIRSVIVEPRLIPQGRTFFKQFKRK